MDDLDRVITDEVRTVRHAARRLEGEFAGIFSRETVERLVSDSLRQLAESATVTSHLPLLAERFARERLRAIARGRDTRFLSSPSVLFVCAHNAGRSQMAAGWMRQLAGDRVVVWSSGSQPADHVSELAVQVMAEVGVDLAGEFPKPWTDDIAAAADVVITMGCGDACPVHPGKRYEEWALLEPAGRDLDGMRRLRDELRARIEGLLRSMNLSGAHDRGSP